jgi:hypothetical protein
MKNNYERYFIRIFPYSLFLAFTLLITGCDNEPADETSAKIIGTWHQNSQTSEGVMVTKDSTRLLMQINTNQICIMCDSSLTAITNNKIVKRSGWSYTGGLLNIATDIPVSWKPVVENNTLTLEKIEFNQTGTIKKTIQTYTRITDIDID